jgi:hypothetical protein
MLTMQLLDAARESSRIGSAIAIAIDTANWMAETSRT